MKTGFIGLGIMRKPMYRNLLKAGYGLMVMGINPESTKEFGSLAQIAQSPKEVALCTDVIITMLPNSSHVKDMINVLDTFHNLGIPLPLSAAVMEMMQALKADGLGNEDHCSLVKYYEKISNLILRTKSN